MQVADDTSGNGNGSARAKRRERKVGAAESEAPGPEAFEVFDEFAQVCGASETVGGEWTTAWRSREAGKESAPDKFSLLAQSVLKWMFPILFRSSSVHRCVAFSHHSGPLKPQDLPGLRNSYVSSSLAPQFLRAFDDQLRRGKPSITRALLTMRSIRRTLLAGLVCGLVQGLLLTVARPLILKWVIESIETGRAESVAEKVGIVAVYCVVVLVEGWLGVFARQLISEETGAQFQVCASAGIYRKMLRLKTNGKRHESIQNLSETDLFGNDVVRAVENVRNVANLPSAVSGLIGGVVALVLLIGSSSIVGLAVMSAFLLFNVYVGRYTRKYESKSLSAADSRLAILKNMIQGIKAVKMFSWESKMSRKIQKSRIVECTHIKTIRLATVSSIVCGRASPVLSSMAAIITFALTGNQLTVASAFAVVSVFQALRLSLVIVPLSLTTFAAFSVNLSRIGKYMTSEEHPSYCALSDSDAGKVAVVRNSNLGYGENSVLSSVNLEVGKKQLIAVVGFVGAGKTTLLSAVTQAIKPLNVDGSIRTTSSIGFAPQKAFIICGTIKQNILMGRPYDERRYVQALVASALVYDLKVLSNLDDTEVGERGTTLSGGQMARLGVARALYEEPELLVFDDPLSAVDVNVSKHIFDHAIKGYSQRTSSCIVAVNQLDLLPFFDRILFVHEGKVSQGTFAELAESNGEEPSEFKKFIEKFTEEVDKDSHGADAEKAAKTAASAASLAQLQADMASLLEKKRSAAHEANLDILGLEGRQEGIVSTGVYLRYLRAMGLPLFFLAFSTTLVGYGLMAGSDYWLTLWAQSEEGITEKVMSTEIYAVIYLSLSLGFAAAIMCASVLMVYAGYIASKSLHETLLGKLVLAPLSWWDANSAGRIISRFSGDLNKVDMFLALMTDNTVQLLSTLLVYICLMCISVPMLLIVVALTIPVYAYLVRLIDRTSREVKRLSNNALSPLLSNGVEASVGRNVITSMQLTHYFEARHRLATDEFVRMSFVSGSVFNVAYLFSHFVAFMLSLATITLLVALPQFVNENLIGLALTYSLFVPYFCSMFTSVLVRLNTHFTSLERILEYEDLPQEAAFEKPEDPDDWPQSGKVVYEGIALRYRTTTPLVLKDVSFTIPSGKSVGVIGRTGAGKSSLVAVLFRLNEATGGRILVDGVDISTLGLKTLRQNITIIPQDPVLASGTIRSNLDPFDEYSDEQLISSLRMSGLKVDIGDEVESGGKNFSSGERQLLCFARSFLRKNKIVVMDEPTASCDMNTDEMIQRLVKEEYLQRRGCTLITIAHRLNTVSDYDYILVMAEGRVAEMDSPKNLLADKNSFFSQMVETYGESTQEVIKSKAEGNGASASS